MLASGQMGFDIKNNYIKQSLRSQDLNKNRASIDQSLKVGRSPPENIKEQKQQEIDAQPNPQDELDEGAGSALGEAASSAYPEETFKQINHQLKLNQSGNDSQRAKFF